MSLGVRKGTSWGKNDLKCQLTLGKRHARAGGTRKRLDKGAWVSMARVARSRPQKRPQLSTAGSA